MENLVLRYIRYLRWYRKWYHKWYHKWYVLFLKHSHNLLERVNALDLVLTSQKKTAPNKEKEYNEPFLVG